MTRVPRKKKKTRLTSSDGLCSLKTGGFDYFNLYCFSYAGHELKIKKKEAAQEMDPTTFKVKIKSLDPVTVPTNWWEIL